MIFTKKNNSFCFVVLLGLQCYSISSWGFSKEDILITPSQATVLSEKEEQKITSAEDTPVSFDDVFQNDNLFGSRAWRAPEYSHQSQRTGYSANVFDVPAGMQHQVQFWVDIYSKYSTTQGVIHDAEEIDRIYEVVDFSEIEKLKGLPLASKERLKKNMVKEAKKRALETLKKVKSAKNSEGMNSVEKKLWEKRDHIEAENIRFQLGQKDRMLRAIYISGRYLEEFEKIFADQNLPIELTRLVFVESSFNVLARSKVGASGLWQIMPYTARPYRMLSSAVDLRNHPIEATKLAARLLRSNYEMLQSWPLAVTGYNHGPTGVLKMTKHYKTRSIAELIDIVQSRRSFGFASRNFYACFLAALEVEKNAKRYFPNVSWSQEIPSESLRTPVALSFEELSKWFQGETYKTQIFNPHITKAVVAGKGKIPARTWVAVPADQYHQFLADLTRKKLEESKKRNIASDKATNR
jgi:membrane-bound lytic murein transglycosylase D